MWKPSAEQDLASAWLAATDRQAMTMAANYIDRLLADDPESLGDVRFDTVRTLVEFPLGVEFEVVEQDRIVWVLAAWDASKVSPP